MNLNPINWFRKEEKLDESTKSFKNKDDQLSDKQVEKQTGEGISELQVDGYGATGLSSFNNFYQSYINKQHANEIGKIGTYRSMSENPEISDVIEDAVNESLQENEEGKIIDISIEDESINKKEELKKKINSEFSDFFYNRLKISDKLWDLFNTYYIDGRFYTENVINESRKKDGIIDLKILPSETMDKLYDKYGRIIAYIQYKQKGAKKPTSLEEAEKEKEKYIVFYPSQINFLAYQFGHSKNVIYGYLEKCKIPYNQLKLLETSMVIYRIVRAPERFVFKIDTGNMPRDKSMKYVQKIKQKMNKKESFDPNSGTLLNNSEILSIQDNFFIPQGENRGSDITTIGGSNIGFKDLDDIHYFQKKLYRSLKYPLSRIENRFEERSGDNLFRGNSIGEITRDEIKWSKFLERQQDRVSEILKDVFLLHLDFKQLKDQFGLDKNNFRIEFNPPSDYREQMRQQLRQMKFDNYMQLSNEAEFSKKWLMMRYLGLTEEEIKENADMKKEDKKLGLVSEDDGMGF